jgi:DNA-binding NarL/FixJ family response regulator
MSQYSTPSQPHVLPRARAHGSSRHIRVAIVENHQLVADSLALLLDAQANVEVVGKARTVAEVASMSKVLAPDVAVLDFHLDDGTGRDAALLLRGLFPNVRFVFLSRDGSDRAMLAAIEVGASAYLLKSGPASEVIDAVRKVAEGQSLISPATIARLVSSGSEREQMRHSLSHREIEVLQLMADGVPTREISRRLGISYSTVRSHVRSISSKLGTRSMVSTVVTARELELIS